MLGRKKAWGKEHGEGKTETGNRGTGSGQSFNPSILKLTKPETSKIKTMIPMAPGFPIDLFFSASTVTSN